MINRWISEARAFSSDRQAQLAVARWLVFLVQVITVSFAIAVMFHTSAPPDKKSYYAALCGTLSALAGTSWQFRKARSEAYFPGLVQHTLIASGLQFLGAALVTLALPSGDGILAIGIGGGALFVIGSLFYFYIERPGRSKIEDALRFSISTSLYIAVLISIIFFIDAYQDGLFS